VNFMERLSILTDGDVVQPADLPAKILDQVGDLAALPPVEEEKDEPIIVKAESAPIIDIAPSGEFVWPSLAELDKKKMNLKEFLDAIENRLIDEALAKAEGVKNQAAEYLGIKRTTLIEKLKKRGM
ncbi:MAG: sigma-54-dependent Fis family transcriptional regulator, partial [Desulfovibrio sp.]|nr:sigma-54-dependent Fis family transcriptional regulator [Desulfovibrio sp.]